MRTENKKKFIAITADQPKCFVNIPKTEKRRKILGVKWLEISLFSFNFSNFLLQHSDFVKFFQTFHTLKETNDSVFECSRSSIFSQQFVSKSTTFRPSTIIQNNPRSNTTGFFFSKDPGGLIEGCGRGYRTAGQAHLLLAVPADGIMRVKGAVGIALIAGNILQLD